MSDRFYLVDGSGYIFRAFFAIQYLSTADGFPTNALFGFMRMLLKLLAAADGEPVVVVFDAGRKNFRHDLFEQYKANRVECPKELELQMPYFPELCRAIGLPVLVRPGYEADDIIATLTDRLTASGEEVIIVSGDKDLMQLVGSKACVWDTMRDKWYREPDVREKWGVVPGQIIDLLALTGDSSDNIPGVAGIGPKTAVQLLERFGSLENVLASGQQIRDDATIRSRAKIADVLESSREIAELSKTLATVCRSVPLDIRIEGQDRALADLTAEELVQHFSARTPDRAKLSQLVRQFEFQSIFDEMKVPLGAGPVERDREVDFRYTTVWGDGFAEWVEQFRLQKTFALDLETTALHVRDARIVGVAISWDPEGGFYIPVGHRIPTALQMGQDAAVDDRLLLPNQVALNDVLDLLRQRFNDPGTRVVGQNLKYDLSVLENYGVSYQGPLFDTMVAAYLINPDRNSFGLTSLAKEYLDLGVSEYSAVTAGVADFSEVAVDRATAYAAEDAHVAWLLADRLKGELDHLQLTVVAEEIDFPLVKVLAEMEWRGVHLEIDILRGLSAEFEQRLRDLSREIFDLAGQEFNINSPKQLSDILFGKLQLPTKGLKRTKSGVSTDSGVLEKLLPLHPIAGVILHYRLLHKLKSTYIDALPQQVSPVSRRLHSRFNQTGTGTGRLSSSEPNLQNIPIHTSEGRRIRTAFTAPAGKVIVSADYSQIELRLLAHLSEDEQLIDAFCRDEDIHSRTARQILGFEAGTPVPPDARRIGKTINFGVIYGMSALRLGNELGISVGTASQYIQSYFAQFPRVKSYFAQLEAKAGKGGEVRTLFGRRRVLTSLDTQGRDRNFVSRVAVNAPIQGSAADLIKLAMIRISRQLRERGLRCELVLQVHDELVFECAEPDLSQASSLIRHEMESVHELRVPLKVDLRAGESWEQAHG